MSSNCYILLSLMVNETTDISNKEQVGFVFRWVGQFCNAHVEEFLDLYCARSTEASVNFSVMDVLMNECKF